MSDPKLKLFVVGESSGDPSTWSQWTVKTLVVAETAVDALRMADRDSRSSVAEVVWSDPCILMAD
jgi:hypothetical protein